MRSGSLVCGAAALLCILSNSARSGPDDRNVEAVVRSTNSLGLDLYRGQIKSNPAADILLSPWSISSALAMTYMGSAGDTAREMSNVLRLPADKVACGEAFQGLTAEILQTPLTAQESPVLSIANRLFVQKGFKVIPLFVEQSRNYFRSELTELDFKSDPEEARQVINRWVEEQTHDRIRDLFAPGSIHEKTHLTLVNAIYLRVSWEGSFDEANTKAELFHLNRKESRQVLTMKSTRDFGYSKRRGFTVVTLPYFGRTLQCVLIVPDAIDGLAKIESSITEETLSDFRNLEEREVSLYIPRFKLAPPSLSLGEALQSIGLHTAFDIPERSANFTLIAPPTEDGYLALNSVVHRAWLSLDETGTEAAAATGGVIVLSPFGDTPPKPPPVVVRVNRPFMFVIQHVESGVCLFLGRVTNPKSDGGDQ